jgi:murein DD-endopeptidase MepM/ murein hydrolase activator NlpD
MARLFFERHIFIRGTTGVRHVRVPPWLPAATLLATGAGIAGAAHVAAGYVEVGRLLHLLRVEVAVKQVQVDAAENTKEDLREHVAALEERLAATTRDLEAVRQRLVDEAAQNTLLRGQLFTAELQLRNLEELNGEATLQRDEAHERLAAAETAYAEKSAEMSDLEKSLEAARHNETQRNVIAGRLKLLEGEREAAAQRVHELKSGLDAAEKKAAQAVAERDRAQRERDRMRTQLAELEKRVTTLAGAAPIPAASDSKHSASQGLGGWSDVERLLTASGIDVAGLMSRFNAVPPAQGGPFVAIDPRQKPMNDEVSIANLQKMLKSLPLAEPLDGDYQLESRFGMRRDPFNKRQALHAGLDFSAPFRSPVYNTAPGTVIFAGAKAEYGRVVEVDHGHGIVTRYAHLHRAMVVPGQRLTGRELIGQLGSSGRSSGPHLHYEVLVNGVAQNPERFLEAGRSAVTLVKN